MANPIRLRPNFVYGTLSDNLLTNSSGATTMNSGGLGSTFCPTVGSPNYFVVILDPQQQHGAPEIVYVTTHTGAATTATVLRGQEGTTIRAHVSGEFWVAGPTALDLNKGFYGARMQIGSGGSYAPGTTKLNMTVQDDASGSCTGGANAKYVAAINGYYVITYRLLVQPSAYPSNDVRLQVLSSSGTPFLSTTNGLYASFQDPYLYGILSSRWYLAAGAWAQPALNSSSSSGSIVLDGSFTDFSITLDELG